VLEELDGHVLAVHFKDLAEKDPNTHDVPWGAGICNARGAAGRTETAEIPRRHLRRIRIPLENSSPEIAQSLKFFNSTCADLAASMKK